MTKLDHHMLTSAALYPEGFHRWWLDRLVLFASVTTKQRRYSWRAK